MSLKNLLLVVLFTVALAFNASGAAPDGTASPPKPAAAVHLEGRRVLEITVGALSFTPAERAGAASARLSNAARDPHLPVDGIAVAERESTSEIVAEDLVLLTVTEEDAAAKGKTRQDLAREYAAAIREAILEHRSERSVRTLAAGAAKAAAWTLGLAVCLVAIRRLFPLLASRIESCKGSYIRSLRFQSIELLSQDRIVASLLSALRFMRLFIVLGLFYLYIPLVLSLFPQTEGVAERLFQYIETPVVKVGQAILDYLPNLFFIAVIAVCTHYVISFSQMLFREIELQRIAVPGFYPDWAQPSFKIVRFLIIAFAVVVAFPYLPGSSSPAFKGISVFLGLLFSLGSSSAIANVVAGAILTYMRAFTVGDRVKIADTMGDITEKTLLVTRIRTIKNVDITIPNAMVLGSHIINYSSSSQLILHTTLTIGYDVPWRKVHELLIAAARSTERIMPEPSPFVLQTALNDFYVSYELNAYTDTPQAMAAIYSELHKNIQDRFNEAGVEIMSPHYSSLRDGNAMAIPPDYLPPGYAPAAHRINQG